MLSVLLSGRLIRDPATRSGRNGKPYTTALVSVPVDARAENEADRMLVSVIAFGDAQTALATLRQGDDVSVTGSAKLTTWTKEGTEQTGLSVTASRIMTAYQRRKTQRAQADEDEDC